MSGIIDFRTEIEDENGDAINYANPFPVTAVSQGLTVLQRIAALLKPLQQITGGGSNRLSVDVNNVVGGNVTLANGANTIGSINNVNSIVSYANVWTFDQAKAISRLTYNQSIRSRIS